MSNANPMFVFVHGAWHDAATWCLVTPLLEARGHVVRALDLPGAGRNAEAPVSYGRRPLDLAAFAIERSPNAEPSQQDRTRAVVALIDEVTRNEARPVVLVGHSLGGLTASAVAESIPECVSAVVYLTAFLLPPGMTALTMIEHPTMTDSLVPPLFLADPGLVQAMRIDPRSDRPDYVQRTKSALYGDVFRTKDLCYPTGLKVTHGETYQVSLAVNEAWSDRGIPASPEGFARSTWMQLAGVPFKRLIWSNWFAPIVRVGGSGLDEYFPHFTRESETSNLWTAKFVARKDGEVFVYVNDTSIFLPWLLTYFYENNAGTAVVSLKKM